MGLGALSIGIFLTATATAGGGMPSLHVEARVSAGTVRAQVSWVLDGVTSADALRGRIEFNPVIDPQRSCRSIRFVQVARVQRNGGADYEWSNGEADRNLLRTPGADESGIVTGFYVDHRASACRFEGRCSPYFRDSWANPAESRDGYQRGAHVAPASLVDYPFGWDTLEEISLESCARCVETGAFLGCAAWGARWPVQGPRELLPITVDSRPSETFLAALDRFEQFHAPAPADLQMARVAR